MKVGSILNNLAGFVLREGSANLSPPRDCDRDESRKHATVPPEAAWEGAVSRMNVSQETWTKPKPLTTFLEGGKEFFYETNYYDYTFQRDSVGPVISKQDTC